MGPLVITMEQAFAGYDLQIDPAYWDTVHVEVQRDDGTLVEGSLDPLEGFSPRLWRPSEVLLSGNYTVTARITPDDECPGYEQAFEITAQEALEFPALPDVQVVSEPHSRAEASIRNYVCCDGAKPYRPDPPGSGCLNSPTPLEWLDGFCTPLTEDHWLRVEASIDESADGFFTLRETTTGDRPAAGSTTVLLEVLDFGCLEFEVLDLANGTSSFVQWCPDAAAKLGVVSRQTVEEELSEQCQGPPYVCGLRWDDPCTLWPDGGTIDPSSSPQGTSGGLDTDAAPWTPEPDEPGACALGRRTSGDGFPLLLVALAARIRRRRGNKAVAQTLP